MPFAPSHATPAHCSLHRALRWSGATSSISNSLDAAARGQDAAVSMLGVSFAAARRPTNAWAERRKIERHPTTGSIQIVEVRERVEEIVIPAPKPSAPAKPKPFANLRKGELMAFGVPEEWGRRAGGRREHAARRHLPSATGGNTAAGS